MGGTSRHHPHCGGRQPPDFGGNALNAYNDSRQPWNQIKWKSENFENLFFKPGATGSVTSMPMTSSRAASEMGVEISATIMSVMMAMKARATMWSNTRTTIVGTESHPCPFGRFQKTESLFSTRTVWRTRQYLWHVKTALPIVVLQGVLIITGYLKIWNVPQYWPTFMSGIFKANNV